MTHSKCFTMVDIRQCNLRVSVKLLEAARPRVRFPPQTRKKSPPCSSEFYSIFEMGYHKYDGLHGCGGEPTQQTTQLISFYNSINNLRMSRYLLCLRTEWCPQTWVTACWMAKMLMLQISQLVYSTLVDTQPSFPFQHFCVASDST